MIHWWGDRQRRSEDDERKVAELRDEMERILRQLEATVEEFRDVLLREGDDVGPGLRAVERDGTEEAGG